ncbi:phosphoribosyltransferase [Sorangium sp. So ce381]|uniref:phosphoribosyltransferase n=1 Tax=Sorangium sp. So ce381 TaxID=3133307 RepID=UPI003F5B3048
MLFRDRFDAGRRLAAVLEPYAGRPDVVVLALPRGGVPVGYEVARRLGAPLDVFVVRKLGVPGHEELAMGAIASGGVRVLDDEVVHGLGVSEDGIAAAEARELPELGRRERLYRGARPPVDVRGRTVILVGGRSRVLLQLHQRAWRLLRRVRLRDRGEGRAWGLDLSLAGAIPTTGRSGGSHAL